MFSLLPLNVQENEKVNIGETSFHTIDRHPLKLPYLVIFIGVKGTAQIQINFKDYYLQPNEIIVLSADSISVILQKSPDFKLFYCMLNKEFAAEVAVHLSNKLFSFLWNSPHFTLNKEEKQQLIMWKEQLQYVFHHSSDHKYLLLRNHLQNFFLQMEENLPHSTENTSKISRQETLCWQFWDMIKKESKTHRNVAYYANKLNITPFYLSKITKEIFNDCPKTLIDRQVILEIKTLLLETSLSIKEIALLLHFEDSSYMCRYFKKQIGVCLSTYRK